MSAAGDTNAREDSRLFQIEHARLLNKQEGVDARLVLYKGNSPL